MMRQLQNDESNKDHVPFFICRFLFYLGIFILESLG